MTGRDLNDNDVVKIGNVVTSTPACVSCTVASDCGEEMEIARFYPEPRLESIPPLEIQRSAWRLSRTSR